MPHPNYTPEELEEILRLHKLWIDDVDGGRKAKLTRADLRGSNLSFAYLNWVDLSGADLTGANLWVAYLADAKLGGAKLCSLHRWTPNRWQDYHTSIINVHSLLAIE